MVQKEYLQKRKEIRNKLDEFRNKNKNDAKKEFMFCLLTPQSNAQKCWNAVEQLSKLKNLSEKKVNNILKSKTRFHNNKTKYILESKSAWKRVEPKLKNTNTIELRNWLAENVKGYGLKEASHFLRNIGLSNNQIAILDRHILKNMKNMNVINETKIKGKSDYLDKEQKFLNLAKSLKIPTDELDLLFWSQENGEIFK